MDKDSVEKQIIEGYQKEEKMMVLVFAQWCINHDLDPVEIYKEAYPTQKNNDVLSEAMELTVSKEEAGPIDDSQLLGVLSLFGNEDLAFTVTSYISKRKD
ncbi:hypothetical protein FLK61_33690 [Paenalkalicoccus suaedae]|uniref:Uncharacterized protein n=1 Tax=Paenalkalicoccus suaedae TaxID=2592382 RepID=A0A859FFM1_9BACI|nr:hypothetical protein [Paenalkalicoccus suaedae]QKS71640.1 hypothetical protein FLK61_33690 [Paenalkalicoccus suaedae]